MNQILTEYVEKYDDHVFLYPSKTSKHYVAVGKVLEKGILKQSDLYDEIVDSKYADYECTGFMIVDIIDMIDIEKTPESCKPTSKYGERETLRIGDIVETTYLVTKSIEKIYSQYYCISVFAPNSSQKLPQRLHLRCINKNIKWKVGTHDIKKWDIDGRLLSSCRVKDGKFDGVQRLFRIVSDEKVDYYKYLEEIEMIYDEGKKEIYVKCKSEKRRVSGYINGYNFSGIVIDLLHKERIVYRKGKKIETKRLM